MTERPTDRARRAARLLLACCALLAGLGLPALAQEGKPAPPAGKVTAFPAGQIVERVACAAAPQQTYRLYLPSNYDPARRWPILYAMDARGVAAVPMERFQPGAEKYGFIVVSSYNSASDGEMQVNFDAMRALWADTHARFSIDDRRIYLAGFSGTVRAACALAFLSPGTIAGIVGAGAGFPFKKGPDAKTDFLFFGTIGDKDFNFYELLDLEDKLTGLALPHRIAEFDGFHEWMPGAVATEALEWLVVRAMKDGRRPQDAALVKALWEKDLAAARALEASRPYHAWLRYRAMAADYAGLTAGPLAAPFAELQAKAAALGASEAVKGIDRRRHADAERDRNWLRTAQRTLATTTETDAVTVQRVVGALEIAKLREKIDKQPGSEEALSALRRLNNLHAQTSFYLPREYAQRKEWARAAFFLSISVAVEPEDPFVHYALGGMRARLGERRAALDELTRAVELGFPDAARLEHDPAYEPLREEPAYRAALETIKKKSAEPAKLEPAPAAGP